MNRLNFNQSIGFPLETNILSEMQTAWSILNALGNIAGNFTILQGCTEVGTTVSDGVVFINGEVIEFKGGQVQSSVIIVQTPTVLEFEDNSEHEVIFTRYATFGVATTQWPWSDFKRGFQTKDLVEALALKATTTAVDNIATQLGIAIDKLATIESNTKVQVRSDWNATTGVKVIDNKPDFSSPFLYKGMYDIGDVTSADIMRNVTFPDVGTSAYFVLGSIKSSSSNWDKDNDVIPTWGNPTNASFELYLREVAGNIQNLKFYYVLIPL